VSTTNGRGIPLLAGTLLSEVEPERVEWLWDGRLPFGKLAVLDGDPGLGKSVVTLDLAARLSAGLELPDGQPCEPAGVVLLSAEDGLRDTIRPRLDAAGADTERIFALSNVFEAKGDERMISLTKDLSIIERAIERVGAGLVVVDPLTAFLSEKTDSYKDQDMRRALTPLATLAERTRAAFLIVRHLTKAAGGNTLYRGGGSIAIIGAARSGLVIAQDPEDPERRILAANKHNLSRPAPSLAFRIGEAPNGAARVEWGGTSPLTARDILKEPADPEQKSALSEAKEFLLQHLTEGLVAAEEVKEDARGAGISERTLKRAKKEMGVGSRKRGDVWYWESAQEGREGGRSSTVGTVGPLGKDAKDEPADSAYLREEDQGCQEGQEDHEPRCIHEFPGGKGCYLCDPEHPHRRKLEVHT
jgi:archaellum biogenesis ATPase FlaH